MATADQLTRPTIVVARAAFVTALVTVTAIGFALFSPAHRDYGPQVQKKVESPKWQVFETLGGTYKVSARLWACKKAIRKALSSAGLDSRVELELIQDKLNVGVRGDDLLDDTRSGLGQTGLAILRRIGHAIATESCKLRVATIVKPAEGMIATPRDWVVASSLSTRVAEVLSKSGNLPDAWIEITATWDDTSNSSNGSGGNPVVICLQERNPWDDWTFPSPVPPPRFSHPSPVPDYSWMKIGP